MPAMPPEPVEPVGPVLLAVVGPVVSFSPAHAAI
jgi:hypothetical protein